MTLFTIHTPLASQWKINSNGLSKSETKTAVEYIKSLDGVLPSKLKSKVLEEGLTFKFKSLNNHNISKNVCDAQLKDTVLGFYQDRNRTITLEKQLLRDFKNNREVKISCRHGSLKMRALATGLHEVFHAYDKSNFKRKVDYRGCPNFLHDLDKNKLETRCKALYELYKRRHEISDDVVFQTKAFWKPGDYNLRPADSYENKNSQELAAVNFEYFILDREFKCRRPAIHNYYVKKFSFTPHANSKCKQLSKVVIGKYRKKLVEIDPARIYQIQYLLASKSDGGSGSFGHSMIKLVVCAPERKDPLTNNLIPETPYGPKCLDDIKYHLVASFRGNVNDLRTNMLKGVLGGYNSILYMMRMPDVMLEYNEIGMRDLYAFPLDFTETQKNLFLDYMLGVYWGYVGNYKLLSVNCATETLQLILSVLNDEEHFVNLRIRPYSILKNLVEVGLLNSKYIKNDFKSLEKRNLFYGKEKYLKKALSVLTNREESTLQRQDLFTYFELEADDRKVKLDGLINEINNGSTKYDNRVSRVASFIILERQSLQHLKNRVKEGILEKVVKLSKNKNVAKEIEAIMEEANSTHHDFIRSGYGIPQENDLPYINHNISIEKSYDVLANSYYKYVSDLIKDGEKALNKIEENIKDAQRFLRKIKEDK